MQTQAYNTYAAGTFGAMAAGFVQTALAEMLPWLFVMTAIIIADLFAGIAKTLKLRMPVRFSKAVRDTMAKFCVYFACVVCFAFYDVASNNQFYAEIACFLIMVIEAASIASNVLKYHGYNLDFNKLFSVIISKKFDVDPERSEGIVTKDPTFSHERSTMNSRPRDERGRYIKRSESKEHPLDPELPTE